MNILIVDDVEQNRKLLRVQLEAEGHTVLVAANGSEALFLLTSRRADCVISDVLMPVMDGFRLCQELRASPQHALLPIVLYTSTYDSPSDRALADSVGADVYLLKPAPIPALMAAIAHAREHAAERSGAATPGDTTVVLKEYNAVLVHKLEERNDELQKLNRTLEARVAERTAALDASNADLEAFAHSISHDLQAPLRHVKGFARLLEESGAARLSGDERAHLQRIVEATDRMDRMIQALLEFSRVGRGALHSAPVDLDRVLAEARAAIRPDTAGRNIRWNCDPLPRVRGDHDLLRQVLFNLLANAVKFTRGRDPAVIDIGQQRGPQPVIFVRDNGVGFDTAHAGKLFGVFQRLHGADEFEGTGIGLANVQRIVLRHGGSVWAQGERGVGATFYVSLPAA